MRYAVIVALIILALASIAFAQQNLFINIITERGRRGLDDPRYVNPRDMFPMAVEVSNAFRLNGWISVLCDNCGVMDWNQPRQYCHMIHSTGDYEAVVDAIQFYLEFYDPGKVVLMFNGTTACFPENNVDWVKTAFNDTVDCWEFGSAQWLVKYQWEDLFQLFEGRDLYFFAFTQHAEEVFGVMPRTWFKGRYCATRFRQDYWPVDGYDPFGNRFNETYFCDYCWPDTYRFVGSEDLFAIVTAACGVYPNTEQQRSPLYSLTITMEGMLEYMIGRNTRAMSGQQNPSYFCHGNCVIRQGHDNVHYNVAVIDDSSLSDWYAVSWDAPPQGVRDYIFSWTGTRRSWMSSYAEPDTMSEGVYYSRDPRPTEDIVTHSLEGR